MSYQYQFSKKAESRRQFLSLTAQAAIALAIPSCGTAPAAVRKSMTVQDVIDTILKNGGLSQIADTVDTIKAGSAEMVVTGIVTTMFATMDIIERAHEKHANFIIAHEPSFYNHRDDKNWVHPNSVLDKKLKLLSDYGITIWRFHDYCHALKPDAVTYGVVKKAGWTSYFKTGQRTFNIPTLPLSELVKHLKDSLGINHVRVIGDAGQPCTRISLLPGAWGGQKQVTAAETEQPDVLIVGELSEWETAEYIRDARAQGRKISLIILGHSVSEEPGMEWVAEWLKPFIPDISVMHMASGDPFRWE